MGNFGIKITKEGKDVSSSNPEDYTLLTGNKTLNVKKRGSVTFSTSIGVDGEPVDGTATVAHNFGYVPQFMAFVTPYVSQYLSKYVFSLIDYVNLDFAIAAEDVGGTIHENVSAYTTNTDIVFTASLYATMPFATPSGIGYEYTVDYILFMEEATFN